MVRRLVIFAFGFLLGSMLVYVMLIRDSDRDFGGWLPEGRVLNKIEKHLNLEDPKTKCVMSCAGIFSTDMEKAFEDGDVNFSKSQPRENPAIYWIEVELSGKEVALRFSLNTQEKVILQEVLIDKKEVSCDC